MGIFIETLIIRWEAGHFSALHRLLEVGFCELIPSSWGSSLFLLLRRHRHHGKSHFLSLFSIIVRLNRHRSQMWLYIVCFLRSPPLFFDCLYSVDFGSWSCVLTCYSRGERPGSLRKKTLLLDLAQGRENWCSVSLTFLHHSMTPSSWVFLCGLFFIC